MNFMMLALVCVIALSILLYIKKEKECFKGRIIKLFVVLVVFLLALVFLSRYYDIAGFFSEDSVVVRTGAAIADVVKENIG